ncbi:MAG: UDP-N-acetylmuramate dehydrogenase [Aliidongia sp.]
MSAAVCRTDLIDRLPQVRGRLTADVPLAPITWFRVGGPAEVMFRPADRADLTEFLANCPADIPVTVIGVASNLLVRDGGVRGVVIRLGRTFAEITIEGELCTAGAGALDVNVALSCAQAGLGGLEFLSGIPGTIGGALRMNAGAYGHEIKDILVGATILDGAGRQRALTPEELDLSYRHCGCPADFVFVEAVLRGTKDRPAAIAARIAAIQEKRQATQPIRSRTGGSTFANPPDERAWELIDRAGCRGLRRNGAMVSDLHTNFLINLGDATAADLEGLGEEVRRRVHDQTGVRLDWEIRRIGEPQGRIGEAGP